MIWKLLRSRAPDAYPTSWIRFDAFLADVGERPSPKHQLRRPNLNEPWSTTNMAWREPIGISSREDGAAYQWRWHLRNKYGLTEDELAAIVKSQDGCCPICTRPLEILDAKTGKSMKVCVDHDHENKRARKAAVRGVVHDACNKGMGMLADTAANCHRAGGYLDAHERRKAAGLTIIDEITMEREPCLT